MIWIQLSYCPTADTVTPSGSQWAGGGGGGGAVSNRMEKERQTCTFYSVAQPDVMI